jgi:hypothetical protein
MLGKTSLERNVSSSCHERFEVLPYSLNSIGNSEGQIASPFGVSGSGEGSTVESKDKKR